MGNARTTSLHERLPVELRKEVERDLVEQPPGRETYEKVYAHYGLEAKGISFSSMCRHGGILRKMARDQWIKELGDHVAGQDLSPRIQGLIRSRLYESLTIEDTKIADLLKAAIAEKSLRESEIKQEKWEEEKRRMAAELERVAASAEHKGRGLSPDVLAEIKSKVLGI